MSYLCLKHFFATHLWWIVNSLSGPPSPIYLIEYLFIVQFLILQKY